MSLLLILTPLAFITPKYLTCTICNQLLYTAFNYNTYNKGKIFNVNDLSSKNNKQTIARAIFLLIICYLSKLNLSLYNIILILIFYATNYATNQIMHLDFNLDFMMILDVILVYILLSTKKDFFLPFFYCLDLYLLNKMPNLNNLRNICNYDSVATIILCAYGWLYNSHIFYVEVLLYVKYLALFWHEKLLYSRIQQRLFKVLCEEIPALKNSEKIYICNQEQVRILQNYHIILFLIETERSCFNHGNWNVFKSKSDDDIKKIMSSPMQEEWLYKLFKNCKENIKYELLSKERKKEIEDFINQNHKFNDENIKRNVALVILKLYSEAPYYIYNGNIYGQTLSLNNPLVLEAFKSRDLSQHIMPNNDLIKKLELHDIFHAVRTEGANSRAKAIKAKLEERRILDPFFVEQNFKLLLQDRSNNE